MECYGSTTMVSDKTEACVYKVNSASMINKSQTGRREACAARHSVRDEKTIKDYQGGKKKDLESHIYLD